MGAKFRLFIGGSPIAPPVARLLSHNRCEGCRDPSDDGLSPCRQRFDLVIDLAEYMTRVGLVGSPTLAEIHRAHVTSIPFENLDPWGGRPVSLDLGELEGKLIRQRRGGYCFEHNLLLAAVLEQSGFPVDLLLARGRTGGWPGPIRPRTHGMLRVWVDGFPWLADVGFGFGGLLEPLPFSPGGPYEQSGWRFRLVERRGRARAASRGVGRSGSTSMGWSRIPCHLSTSRPRTG